MEVISLRSTNNPAVFIVGLLLLILTNICVASAGITLQWKYQLDTAIHFSPLITDNKLVVSTAKGEVYAFDLASGALKWQLDKTIRYWDRSLVVDQQKLYAGRAGGLFEAYDLATGKQIWSLDIGINVQTRPLLVGNILYIPTTHVGAGLAGNPEGKASLLAVDTNNGQIIWSKITGNYALQKPAFNGTTLYVAGSYYDPTIEVDEGGPMRINAYSKKGESLWEYKGLDGFTKSIYADDKAVAYIGYQDFINALDAGKGTELWRRDTGNWTPALFGKDGIIYYGSATTYVFAVSSKNGHVLWKFNIAGGSFNYLLGEPVAKGNVLYFLTQKGDIYALDIHSGEKLWMQPTGSDARAGLSVEGAWLATAAIDGGVRVYRTEKKN